MNIQKLLCVVALTCVFASVGLASSGARPAVGLSLGTTPPSQCGSSGNYECYKFVNDTAAGAAPLVAGGVTIQMVLGGTGGCNAYTWTLPATPASSAVGWLWSNPGTGGCLVSSVTFSVPSNGAITPVLVPVVSQGAQGSQDETDLVAKLTGTAAAPALNVIQNVYKIHK